MVAGNVISGRKDIVALFWENKLGVDVDDNYRIIVFEGWESLNNVGPLKSHLTLIDGPHRPSDRFLRLQFNECLAVSVCRGDVMEDYREQEIEIFMEELGVYDNEIDPSDPRWSTPLGTHVHAYLVRQKMTEKSVLVFLSGKCTTEQALLVIGLTAWPTSERKHQYPHFDDQQKVIV
ncbi:hypothetical protein BYT27DRAFT_7086574 [Phlegmacium glaucopus]|nr:hypothetical protein BYT27DRAFT_7086574 [Phlegmacium glaucopus]